MFSVHIIDYSYSVVNRKNYFLLFFCFLYFPMLFISETK